MSWICRKCSTENPDEFANCFVCDEPRAAAAARAEHTEARRGESREARSDRSEEARREERRELRMLMRRKISIVGFVLIAFLTGQAFMYAQYFAYGYVFLLSDLLRAAANESFGMHGYLAGVSAAGALTAALTSFFVCGRLGRDARGAALLAAVPEGIVLAALPALGVWPAFAAACALFVCRKTRHCTLAAIVCAAFVAAASAVFLATALSLDARYVLTFEAQGGTGGTPRAEIAEGEGLPAAEAPVREGYLFLGYFDDPAEGKQYYDASMQPSAEWDKNRNATLYAHWEACSYTVVFDRCGGTGGTHTVTAVFGSEMPEAEAPTRTGYAFTGYYGGETGGTMYYDAEMNSAAVWALSHSATLYAHWEALTYKVTFDKQGGTGGTSVTTATFDEPAPVASAPKRDGYAFGGYFTQPDGKGSRIYDAQMNAAVWKIDSDAVLYAYWPGKPLSASLSNSAVTGIDSSKSVTVTATGGSGSYRYEIANSPYGIACSFSGNVLTMKKTANNASGTVFVRVTDRVTGASVVCSLSYATTGKCVAAGTLVTLADGSMVPVETLTGDERLLVWDLHTGTYGSAPVLFIDSEAEAEYEVIELTFSDGTKVEIIDEHAFWDVDLNRYVYLRADAARYIGHRFHRQSEDGRGSWEQVHLEAVELVKKTTSAWSPVTEKYLCYYVNGMLSMPGATEGLTNIFEVDAVTMRFDEEKMREDIERWGLFTYEEFSALVPVSRAVFEAFGGMYLKVAIGKGLTTPEELCALALRYEEFFLSEGSV